MRMTHQSKENLRVADRVQIIPADVGGYMLQAWRGDQTGFIQSDDDGPMIYATPEAACEAVRQVNRTAVIEHLGWAAQTVRDGEPFDLGAGWPTREEAEQELREQGADMSRVELYPARSFDDWQTWEYI